MATVGLTLAAFGLLRAVSQAFLTGPVTRRLGDPRAIVLGVALEVGALAALAMASREWVAFAAIPLLCLGRVATPALQSLMSRHVDAEHQGELQGTLVSIASLTAVAGPLAFTTVYSLTRADWPGAVWLSGAALYLLCAPALARLRESA